jgi:hypothetical protein
MAEEQGDNKALEVIPLFFFDLIARVIPGLFLLFGLSLISGRLASLIKESIPDKVLDSAAGLLSLALLAGYVVGHLISPLVKLLEKWHAKRCKQDGVKSARYDQLRLLCPGVTGILMRIRAEYIMYGGFCVAFVIELLVLVGLRIGHGFEGGEAGGWADHLRLLSEALAVSTGAVLMFFRNQETIGTFQRAVENFYDAAKAAGKLKAE